MNSLMCKEVSGLEMGHLNLFSLKSTLWKGPPVCILAKVYVNLEAIKAKLNSIDFSLPLSV